MEREKNEITISKKVVVSSLVSLAIMVVLILFTHAMADSGSDYDYRRNPPEVFRISCPFGGESEWGATKSSAIFSSVFNHLGILFIGVVILTALIYVLQRNRIVVK
ncbi:MAG: hypothetical protein HEQ40_06485 [Lacibacter sp.]|jgi:hypothetical protein